MTRRSTTFLICGLSLAAMSLNAVAQRRVPVSGAENGLVGIKLYDSGQKVIAMYGSPLEIQPVNFGSAAIGPGGGGAAGGRAGGGAPGRAGAVGGGGSAASAEQIGDLPIGNMDFADDFLQKGAGAMGGAPTQGGGQAPSAAGQGGGRPAGGGAGAGAGASESGVIYTRWVYRRGMSKYGFVLDKQNRVVQVEAIGLQDGKVHTRRGAAFGTTFGSLIKKYGTPDGYDINGDSIVVRFLQRHKVAFRLNRLAKDKPHQVTGIVVAGGK